MQLEFPRLRIFNTTFTSLDGSGSGKPIYRISTSRTWTFLPTKTTIEYIGAEDPEKHRIVAEIIWFRPSQDRSYVHFEGQLYTLNQFLRRSQGFMNFDSFITLNDQTYTWRSQGFEPKLYDTQGRELVSYKRSPLGLREPNSLTPSGQLIIDEKIASSQSALDAVFTSFFIFKACRDVCVPWKQKQLTQSDGATRAASDGRGNYVRLQTAA